MGKTVFLTGASGFLGRRVAERLAGRGWRVRALGRTKPAVESRNVEFIPGDLLQAEGWRDAMKGSDAVVHLAAATGKCAPAEYFRVNHDGTEAIVDAARRAGVGRLLLASTVAVKFRDVRRYYYAQSKQAAEKIVTGSGLEWTIVRPTMIFGRGSAVLAGLRRLAGLPVLPVFGDGRARVQPVFVDDLSDAITGLVEDGARERVVEIGGAETVTIEELLLRLRRAMGKRDGRVMHLPAGALAAGLAFLEPVMRAVLPFTAGQLASFTNDGIAKDGAWTAGMRNIDEMLRSA